MRRLSSFELLALFDCCFPVRLAPLQLLCRADGALYGVVFRKHHIDGIVHRPLMRYYDAVQWAFRYIALLSRFLLMRTVCHCVARTCLLAAFVDIHLFCSWHAIPTTYAAADLLPVLVLHPVKRHISRTDICGLCALPSVTD